ncbi:NADP-dependent malic enzyme-like [Drosophila nasuta]|uniref:NADP-dependent malic enzyme-like n=1 Tax=Drosophila nasuta TaxID=42062 RepID=UPI00295F0F6E|nr:NADP-dependent malic enzyme-like [Drosophila nasuta]
MAQRQVLHGLGRGIGWSMGHKRQPNSTTVRYSHWMPTIAKSDYRKSVDPKYNKGMGYTYEERQRLSLCGLLPPAYRTMKQQLYAVSESFANQTSDLHRYIFLRALRQRHERLYFEFISKKVNECMPIIYTPTVGTACVKFSLLHYTALGLYVTRYDKGHVIDVLKNWPHTEIRAVCITDGERILGLGDQGANGMGISVGKMDLYTALGRIPPQFLMPAVLDVGTNNQTHLADPLYIGIRQERLRGPEYEEIVQEFMDAVVEVWGPQTLIHFEDFATPNAFKFINKYQDCYCYFNDDIQGTAATGLAAFLGVERISKKPLQDHVIFMVGAGSACLGIAKLVIKELLKRNVTEKDAYKNIYISDQSGLVTKETKVMIPDLKPFCKDMPPMNSLEEMVEKFKPSILLGATGSAGIFTEKVLRTMGKHNERPAIFAVSNPTTKAECTAEQAYNFTEGRALFCSGSPFPPVVFNGKRIVPGQANNSFAFPGVALAVMCTRPFKIPDDVFLVAAKTLADYAEKHYPGEEKLFPTTVEACDVAFDIAVNVAKYFFDKGLSNVFPKPDDICDFIKQQQYYTNYDSSLPPVWEYPELPSVPLPDEWEKKTKKQRS